MTTGEASGFTPAHRLAGLTSFIVSMVVTVLALYGLVGYAGPPPTAAAVQGQLTDAVEFFPEPLERAQYLTALVLLPVLLFVFYRLFRGPAAGLPTKRAATLERWAEGLVSAGLLGLLLAGLVLNPGFGWGAAAGGMLPLAKAVSLAAALAGALLTAALLLIPDRFPALALAHRAAGPAARTLAFALAGLAALFSVIGLGSVTDEIGYLVSFNGVFHGMSQVYLGREILHDINYQYGLFPHLIEPLFRIFGLSVLSFSLAMALLNLAAFLLLWPVLRVLVSRVLLAGLTLVAIVYVSYFDSRQSLDLYYQYHPVRFIFPALSLFLASRYYFRGGWRSYYASFVVGSLAILWNSDTGIVVLLSWLMTLVLQEVVMRRPWRAARHLLTGSGIFAATVAAYSLAMVVRYGHAPDYLSAVFYQKFYYFSGFGMLPMPVVHPWNIVALVYAAGLLFAAMHLAERRSDPRGLFVFHLSVLGAGVFSYFQGRSVNSTLAFASYPAIILAAFFADRLLDGPPGKPRAARLALVGAFLFALAFCGVSMARIAPTFIRAILDHGRTIVSPEETAVTRNARFIKEHTRPGEEALILSYHSGIYHLASGTLSPRGIKALTEILTKLDVSLKYQMGKLRALPKIFLGSEWRLESVRGLMLREFKLAAATPDGSMLLLAPREPSAAPASLPPSEPRRGPDFSRDYVRGNSLVSSGRREAAAAAYYEAIRADPGHYEAWHNLGCVLGELGRVDEAVAAFNETLRLRPDHPTARKNLEVITRGRVRPPPQVR